MKLKLTQLCAECDEPLQRGERGVCRACQGEQQLQADIDAQDLHDMYKAIGPEDL